MSIPVQPRLINDPNGDPGLYLDFRFGRRAMLFDLGDTGPLSPRELLRVSHVFISHTHMDHIAGLDRLLRLRLHRPRPLSMLGPPGFVKQVQSRLNSFTWNLLDETAVDFRLTAQSFEGGGIAEMAEFRARERFARRDLPLPGIAPGRVLSEPAFEIRAAALDHGIPSLAFAFLERDRVNVWRNGLEELELPVGPWINAAKQAIRGNQPDHTVISVPGAGAITLGALRSRAFRTGKGQHIAYVTDAADTKSNRSSIIGLARAADQLFIEAAFLEADRPAAAATCHLTARAAGEIAREAGAKRAIPFHYSARYGADTTRLAAEFHTAFAAP